MRDHIIVLARLLLTVLLGMVSLRANDEVGSRICAECHAEVSRRYMATGMGRTSGQTGGGELWERAAFTHGSVSYRVSPAGKGYTMEFERGEVRGKRLLAWFVGSGDLGRSYLFSSDGFLYQAPVSYYASTASWGISPGYESRSAVDLTRAVETGCLQCHASRLQPVAGTQNRFASPPFLEGGVSCERCHGPGAEHVKARRAGRSHQKDIVNPAKLSPDARDSICAQCHLTGAARVARKAKTAYRPGDLLSSSLAVFVWSEGSSELSATSHYEQLQQSACKRASGDQFWCGTCHTPHAAAEASQYRERCLLCHGKKGCTETVAARSANGNDCTACHMPKRDSRAVEHIAFTDHGIVRRKPAPVAPLGERRLISFWRNVDDRDLALGYAVVAAGEPAVRRQALQLLEAAAARDSADLAVLAQLAQFYDRLGREDQAMGLCERILALDPSHIAAAVNLGIYRVKRGASDEAIRLWKAALQRNPALTGARVNLAVAQFRSGQAAEAEASLRTALEYDPDSDTARRMLAEIQGASK